MAAAAPFRTALDEKLSLSRYFYREIQNIAGIEVGPEPALSIFFFRYVPDTGDPNQFNRQLVEEIHKDGRIFMSSTHIDGTVYIRSTILHFRSHLPVIEQTISLLKEKIAYLNEE